MEAGAADDNRNSQAKVLGYYQDKRATSAAENILQTDQRFSPGEFSGRTHGRRGRKNPENSPALQRWVNDRSSDAESRQGRKTVSRASHHRTAIHDAEET